MHVEKLNRPDEERDPIRRDENETNRPQRPKDEFRDHGTPDEEAESEKDTADLRRDDLPELDKDTAEDGWYDDDEPTDFDVDESTG